VRFQCDSSAVPRRRRLGGEVAVRFRFAARVSLRFQAPILWILFYFSTMLSDYFRVLVNIERLRQISGIHESLGNFWDSRDWVVFIPFLDLVFRDSWRFLEMVID